MSVSVRCIPFRSVYVCLCLFIFFLFPFMSIFVSFCQFGNFCGIWATICICREIKCLLYAGFFVMNQIEKEVNKVTSHYDIDSCLISVNVTIFFISGCRCKSYAEQRYVSVSLLLTMKDLALCSLPDHMAAPKA